MDSDFKKWGKYIFSVIIIIIVTICVDPSAKAAETAATQTKQVVRVAFPNSPGFSEKHDDETRSGIVYEWLVEIAKYTGWEYEFVDENDINEAVSQMYSDKYDIMGGMMKLPETDAINDIWFYPEHPMGFNYSVLLYNKDDERIKSFDVSTLNNKTIGVYAGAKSKIKRLENILDFNNLKCELKYYYYDDEKRYENALQNEEVDLLLASDAYVVSDYNIALRFTSAPSYIAAKKSDALLCRQLNDAINKIYSVNPNFSEELFQKYFPVEYKNSTSLTKEELHFVKLSMPIKVAVVNNDNYPFYYLGDTEAKGIVPGLFKLLAEQTGLFFQYVEAASYDEAIELVKTGKADLFGAFISNNIAENLDDLITTRNYLSLNSILLRNKDISLTDADLTEAIVKGSTHLRDICHNEVLAYKNYSDCLHAVESGEADYTMMPTTVLEYLYMQDYYTNVIPIVDRPKIHLSIAMSKNADINLYTVLSKGIINLSEEQLNTVVSGSTLSAGAKKMSAKSLLYSNPVLSSIVISGFFVLVGIIFLMHAWFKMQNKVAYSKLKRAEELSKIRSEFLSRMSHEIRTPLNAIIGFVNLMKISKADFVDNQKNIAKIDSSAKFLLSLVNDILDMSKLENGKMLLDNKPFVVMNLIKQLENIFALMAEEKQLKLNFDCRLTHKNFIGDELRLKQVLTNLLSNAYKFTDNGGTIVVAVEESVGSGDDTAKLRFSVKDNGMGISKENQERIFSSFEQVMRKSRGNQQGTGLGLAISRNLVMLMNSNLLVESEVGKGSEFYFVVELPVYNNVLATEMENTAGETQHNLLSGKRVLLAEDNDLNAEIAVVLLQLQGIEVDRADDGQAAVDKFSNSSEGYYDLILMDLQMPGKNGLEATAEIRSMARIDAKGIPIIAMTANTLKEDRDSAFASGMNGFIPKPFDVEELYRSIEKFFR